jgi:DNA repair exonuclease SbcCD ATPase subunit/predicted phosphodiesterase
MRKALEEAEKALEESEVRRKLSYKRYGKIARDINGINRIIVKSTGKEITNVYHMGDIHIRKSTRRYDEYNEVFENLYKNIEENFSSSKSSIVIICGDILHEKCNYNEISLQIIFNLMERLVSLMDVIVIMGNHDGYTLRENRRDALGPILKRIYGTHKLYYLRDSGIYEYENIVFGVSSIYDNKFIRSEYIDSKKIKIALYHGSVTCSKMQNNFILEKYDRRLEEFIGYDYVMLGDIHKHQYLDKRRRVAYSSSLIQQNHGEDLLDHGYILWDIKSGKSELKRVRNELGFITIKIEENKIVRLPEVLPMKVRLRIKYMNTTKSECDQLLEEFPKGKDVTYISKEYIEEFMSIDKNKVDIEKRNNNVNNVEHQTDLIIEYCKDVLKLDNEMIKNIIKLNIKLNRKIDAVDLDKGLQWTPLNLKFSNMFVYGKGNEIEFSKLTGIIGIIGPNHYGKSSILDIILFALYDRCSRSNIRKDMMNTHKKWFYCELLIEANNSKYKIIRQAIANKKSIRVEVNLYIMVDGKPNCITGKDRNDTNMLIYELVGSYNDFIMTYISLQKAINFTDLNQSDRVDYLIKLSGMDIFDKLLKEGKNESIYINGLKDNINMNTKKVSINELSKEIEELTDKRKDTYDIIKGKQEENNKIDTRINDLYSRKCTMDIVCTEIIDEKLINNYKIELKRLCELKDSTHEEQLNLEKNLNNMERFYTDKNIKSVTTSHNSWLKDKVCVEEEIKSLKNTKMEKNKIRDECHIVGDKKRLIVEMSVLVKSINAKRVEIEEIVIGSDNVTTKKYNELYRSPNKVGDKKSEAELVLIEMEKYKKLVKDKIYYDDIKNMKNILTTDLILLENDIKIVNYKLESVKEEEIVLNCNKNIIAKNEHIDIKIRELENMLDISKKYEKFDKDFLNKKCDVFELDKKCKKIKKILLDNEKNKENIILITKNREIDEEIKNLRETKKVLLDEIKLYSEILGDFIIKIHGVDLSIKEQKKNIIELRQCEHTLKLLNIYTDKIMHRGGLPFMLLKPVNLENKVNILLCNLNLTEFTVKITKIFYNNRCGIEIYKDVNDNMLNILNCSGYEQFIVNLVLRFSIIDISNRWSTNFMAIDEGFSCMDETNLTNLELLFEYLRDSFKFVFIVSHLDELKSNCNEFINIVKPISTSTSSFVTCV